MTWYLQSFLLVAWHLFLIANIVSTSKAPVTTSVGRVSLEQNGSEPRHTVGLAAGHRSVFRSGPAFGP